MCSFKRKIFPGKNIIWGRGPKMVLNKIQNGNKNIYKWIQNCSIFFTPLAPPPSPLPCRHIVWGNRLFTSLIVLITDFLLPQNFCRIGVSCGSKCDREGLEGQPFLEPEGLGGQPFLEPEWLECWFEEPKRLKPYKNNDFGGWNVDLRSQNFSNLIKTMISEIQASGGAPEE